MKRFVTAVIFFILLQTCYSMEINFLNKEIDIFKFEQFLYNNNYIYKRYMYGNLKGVTYIGKNNNYDITFYNYKLETLSCTEQEITDSNIVTKEIDCKMFIEEKDIYKIIVDSIADNNYVIAKEEKTEEEKKVEIITARKKNNVIHFLYDEKKQTLFITYTLFISIDKE